MVIVVIIVIPNGSDTLDLLIRLNSSIKTRSNSDTSFAEWISRMVEDIYYNIYNKDKVHCKKN